MKFLRIILFPLSLFWRFLYAMRRFLYNVNIIRSYDLGVPVISIGNISFGGTGKTPHALLFVELLDDLGLSSSILTRGYKSSLERRGGIVSEENLHLAGDEPQLVFENTSSPIIVGQNRVKNFFKYGKKLNKDIVLLDDGFQHLKIRRSVDAVLIDATTSPFELYPGPLGKLRESFRTLEFADFIVLTKVNLAPKHQIASWKQLIKKYTYKKVFESKIYLAGIYQNDKEIEFLPSQVIYALSGIGNPSSFDTVIGQMGLDIKKHFVFSDHHDYNLADLDRVTKEARESRMPILTTEKDYMKIRRMMPDENDFYYIKIRVAIDNADEMMEIVKKRIL